MKTSYLNYITAIVALNSSPIDGSGENVIALNYFKLYLIKSQWQLKCFVQVIFFIEYSFTFSFRNMFDTEKLNQYTYSVPFYS